MFDPGHDPLPLTLPEQPWTPDQGVAPWLSPLPADDFETWLPMPQAKTDLGDVGPMFIEDEGTPIDDVIVTARRVSGGDYYDGGYSQGWDGHDTSQTEPPPILEELPACVSAAPANIDEDMLMKIIQYLTDELRGVYNNIPGNIQIDSSRYEYGVLIYELNGQIGYGDITTSNSPDYVNILPRGVPDGARIIGYMYNHPDNSINGGVPSTHPGGNWDEYRDLVNRGSLSRGITVDPNLLLVLYSSHDSKTRIYDKNDRNTNTPSCAI